jgi:hypothetical protein
MQTDKLEHEGRRQTDRRSFLSQLVGVAATAALKPMQAVEAAETSTSSEPLPVIRIGKHQISRLVAGSNPILGYSYSGQHTDRQMRDYYTPERTVEFLQNCERAGITTHQFADPDRALPYIHPLRERGSRMSFICLHSRRETIKDAVERTQPIAMVHHGGATDQLFSEGKASLVHDYVKAAHDCGVLAGVSAHNPDCIKRMAEEGWEVDFFMTCFYFLTRKTAKKDTEIPMLDFGLPFFRDDPKEMTRVVRQVRQPCFAFKILGSGRHCSNQQTVRAAFKFAFENIKPSDGVIVGMFPWFFDEVGANARLTRELGKTA